MKISNGIEMLEIKTDIIGRPRTIFPTLIWDDNNTILVDTGFPGMISNFHETVSAAGVSFNSINKIILTHQDIDHVGCLSAILTDLQGSVEVFSHEEEKPYIQGEKRPVKLAQLEANLDSLPEHMKMMYTNIKNFYDNNKVNVDTSLSDGQELPFCGGIVVIHTPGHTPGHICLYHKESKTLIAGDSLTITEGALANPSPTINLDTDLAKLSLKKLEKYDIQQVISYHGGLYRGSDIKKRLNELSNL